VDWFSALFAVAAMIAIASGKACFRGFTVRSENPSRYWSIIGGYVALALLLPALRLIKDDG